MIYIFFYFSCFDVLIPGLQVVVAQLYREWWIRSLRAGVFRFLLRYQTENH